MSYLLNYITMIQINDNYYEDLTVKETHESLDDLKNATNQLMLYEYFPLV